MKRGNTEERLNTLKELMHNPATINDAYKIAAAKYHTSVAAMRMTALRGGLTSKDHSLRHLLSKTEEEGLVSVLLKYAHRGKPLSFSEISELVGRYKGF